MVRKSWKKGVRTGNTIRASNFGYIRSYHAESCIVRRSSNIGRRQTSHEADDDLIGADDVMYSLNKKGRWSLPSLIKKHISDEESDVTISMYKRHKVTRHANCVEFYCNKGERKSVIRERGYFNATSVQRVIAKGKDGTWPDPEPEVRYDVFDPSPASSSISHDRKYIRSADIVTSVDGVVREAGRCRRKGKHRRRVQVNCDENISDFEESDSFDDRQSENDDEPHSDDFTEIHSPEVMLLDLLDAAKRAKKLCTDTTQRGKVKVKKSTSDDEEWVVINREGEEENTYNDYFSGDTGDDTSSMSRISTFPPTPKLVSVRIILPSEHSQPDNLHRMFQHRYTECSCRPRKFIIDTTQAVHEAMEQCKFSRSIQLASLDLSSCLVFSREANYDTGLEVYGVKLNINSSLEQIRLETVLDLMRTSVDEVVHAAAVFVTTLPLDSFKKMESHALARASEKQLSFQFISTINHWKVDSVILHDVNPCTDGDFEAVPEADSLEPSAEVDGSEHKTLAEYCNICFEDINPELMDSASSTALQSCGHWFCDGCWREHVTGRIYSGEVTVRCPEYACDSVIDPATVLSLVNIRHALMLQRQKLTLTVEKSTELKWCPNPMCGRVLKSNITNGEGINVPCECGTTVCFTCLSDAHWPASCAQAKAYASRLRVNNDDMFVCRGAITVTAKGKHCPSCKRFIVKNGGCNSMTCLCGFFFCWRCLGDDPGSHVKVCPKIVGHTTITITPITNPATTVKSNMYKLALANRIQRTPRLVQSLQSDVNSLSTRLSTLFAKGVDIGTDHIPGGSKTTTAVQLHEFLLQMMRLKLELNHVIEHTAVLLDGRMIRSGSRKMARICDRLEAICRTIESDFSRKSQHDILRALPSLVYLRFMARRGVTALVFQLSAVGSFVLT